jgi:CrcB protein
MQRYLLIALFGLAGVLVRAGVVDWAPRQVASFPWATFVINIVGSLLLGFVYALTPETLSTTWRLAIGIGGLGAMTTFSTMMYETMSLVEEGRAALALTYAFGSLAVGLAVMYAGTVAGRRF